MTRKANSRSSVTETSENGGRYASLTRQNPDGRGCFAACQRDLLADALDLCIDAGDLVSFSRTSDGGAICIYVKSGNQVFKTYAITQQDVDETVEVLAAT